MAATVERSPSAWAKPTRVFEFPQAESCRLCPAGALASVLLRPCVHKLCASCAEQAPARGLKADNGVKCPFCRQYVEEFVPLTGEIMGIDSLAPASIPASNPAVVCAPDKNLPDLANNSLAQRSWKCSHCNQSQNSGFAEMCKSCGRLKPDSMVPQPPKGKDTMKYDMDEVIATCQTKWHPNLNRAFLEAGVPINNGVVQGDRESILAAFRKNGQEKILKIIRTLAGSCRMYELCQNMFASHAIQDLMEGVCKLREVAREGRKLNLPQPLADNLPGITSCFGLLFNNILETLCEMSVHPTCFYVVRQLMRLCNLDELCAITSAILPQCMEVASNEKGGYVVDCLLECLIGFQAPEYDSYQTAKAKAAVDNVACAMHGLYQMMTWIACHSSVGGSIFLRILQGSLPLYNGLQVGSFLSSYAHELVQTKIGTKLVVDILNLQQPDSRDILRDLVCCTALSLQGSMASYAVLEPVDGFQLVHVLIQRLVDEGEIEWVAAITKELMAQGEDVLQNDFGKKVLLFGMSLNILQPQTVDVFVKKMSSLGLDTQILHDVALLDHCRKVDKGLRPHWRDSIISPWLKFHIDSGNEILTPPPPPPSQFGSKYGKFQHVQPPRPESNQRSYSMPCPGNTAGMKSSIWAENLGFPPVPPIPKSYKPLTSVPEHSFGMDHPPSAKLPADLMESLNSESPETSAEADRQSGLVDFGEIPAPPPAMYRYPGNWNFPDMRNSGLTAADLDVSGVISQFQGAMINDQKSRVHEMLPGPRQSPTDYAHSEMIGIGEMPRSDGLTHSSQGMFMPTSLADVKSGELDCGAAGGGLLLHKGPTWEGQLQDIVGVHKTDSRNFAYNRISRDQVSFFDPDLCF